MTHYKLWRRGEVEGHKARYKLCSKEACKKSAGRYGLCDEHRGVAPKRVARLAAAAPASQTEFPAAAQPSLLAY